MYPKLLQLAPEQVFLVQGDEKTFNEILSSISEEKKIVEYIHVPRFTKENASTVVTFNLERDPGSWCVIFFDVFMLDAAQVLLKTLEEPREGIHIVCITPHPYLVPQTIRSRVRILLNEHSVENLPFLASKKALTEYIKGTLGDETIDAGDRRAQASRLLDALEYRYKDDPLKLTVLYEGKNMLLRANMPTKQVAEYVTALIF